MFALVNLFPMNPLDIIIIVTMAFFLIRGIFRGFFKEIGSLTGVIAGIFIANYYQPLLTAHLTIYMPSAKFLPLFSFAAIFFSVFIVCSFAGEGAKKLMEKVFLGWADKTLGAALALLKGIILGYLFIIILTFFVPAKAPLIAESKLSPVIISSYQYIAGFVSPGAYERWKKKFLDKNEKKKTVPSVKPKKVRSLTAKNESKQTV